MPTYRSISSSFGLNFHSRRSFEEIHCFSVVITKIFSLNKLRRGTKDSLRIHPFIAGDFPGLAANFIRKCSLRLLFRTPSILNFHSSLHGTNVK